MSKKNDENTDSGKHGGSFGGIGLDLSNRPSADNTALMVFVLDPAELGVCFTDMVDLEAGRIR